jgi:hypothetical protein
VEPVSRCPIRISANANGIAIHYEYDAACRLVAVTESVGATQAADYQTNLRAEHSYERLGNLLVCPTSHNTTVVLSTVIPYV